MRLVVDTNIFVSAALKDSSWPGAVFRWLEESGGLLKTAVTEDQVIEVLQRPYFASKLPPTYLDKVRRMFAKAELVTIVERIAACRDLTDDKFLELAVNGRADMIVTGDLDLLVLNPFRGIPIITPMAFSHAHARAG
jgi:putative PIN family toxin of toxin-antitoxin system